MTIKSPALVLPNSSLKLEIPVVITCTKKLNYLHILMAPRILELLGQKDKMKFRMRDELPSIEGCAIEKMKFMLNPDSMYSY